MRPSTPATATRIHAQHGGTTTNPVKLAEAAAAAAQPVPRVDDERIRRGAGHLLALRDGEAIRIKRRLIRARCRVDDLHREAPAGLDAISISPPSPAAARHAAAARATEEEVVPEERARPSLARVHGERVAALHDRVVQRDVADAAAVDRWLAGIGIL